MLFRIVNIISRCRFFDKPFAAIASEFELGDFHQLAVLQSGLMRDNSRDGQIERHGDVYERVAIFENRSDKLVRQISVRAAVEPGATPGGSGGRLNEGSFFSSPSYLP